MKWTTSAARLAAGAAAGVFLIGTASAGELADACVERLAADGRDTSGCACLEEKVEGDQALIDELTALGEIDDPAARYEAASAAAKTVMDACTR
ncbi:hypothetical protein [Amphiplicatus metriothermophilus]|nr:hypothetical protein [Amphiplicatus metriothermophilus]MBB5517627.1 hypothetical protein [Amphiplicatus metriothermophilus]